MTTHTSAFRFIGALGFFVALSTLTFSAQTTKPTNGRPASPPPATTAKTPPPAPPPDYVIGPDDVLSIGFWRDKELSADVTVRPDGQISLPLINDLHAAGLTPEQLRQRVTAAAQRFVEDPTVSIVVKAINSRKVFIVGNVGRPGPYPLGGPMTFLQLIAIAGGLSEFADKENIVIVRAERRPDGEPVSIRINYEDLMKRRNLRQNVDLKPGDTIMVP